MEPSKVIYSICIEDIQTVASEILGRELKEPELALVEDKVENYIDWFGAIELALQDSKIE